MWIHHHTFLPFICTQPFALVGVPEKELGGFPWVWIDFGREPIWSFMHHTSKIFSLVHFHLHHIHTHTSGESAKSRAVTVTDGSHQGVRAREMSTSAKLCREANWQFQRAGDSETMLWAAGERDEPYQEVGKEDPGRKVRGLTVLSRGSGSCQERDRYQQVQCVDTVI